MSEDKKLNGFNDGRDTTDGVGGQCNITDIVHHIISEDKKELNKIYMENLTKLEEKHLEIITTDIEGDDPMKVAMIQSKAHAQFTAEMMVKFSEWKDNKYALVFSEELNRYAYVTFQAGVMAHGSDYHYTKLINEHGKTIAQLRSIYLDSLK